MISKANDEKEIINILKKLDTTNLTQLLVEILNKLDFNFVEVNNDNYKEGKNIFFSYKDNLNRETWYSCLIVAENIDKKNVFCIIKDLNDCFKTKYSHSKKGVIQIQEIILVVNGEYEDSSKNTIKSHKLMSEKKITFWNIKDLYDYVLKFEFKDIFKQSNNDISLNLYNQSIIHSLSSNDNLKFLESDFDINIDSFENLEIDLRIKFINIGKEKNEYLDNKGKMITNKLLPDIEKILNSKKYVLLHGIATSGKTTTLKRIGKSLLKKDSKSYVFYFELNKLVKDKLNLENSMKDEFEKISNSKFLLDDISNKILILLDGLDEISDDKIRNNLIDEIQRLSSNKFIHIVLSSRTSEYIIKNSKLELIFDKYELLPLNIYEMIEIGNKVINNSDQSKNFIKLVKHKEIINAFPKTPLTTILLAILFKEDKIDIKEMPRNITELYSKFTSLFLNKWDKNKGISEQYTIQQKEFVVKKIAEFIHSKKITSIPCLELEEFLHKLKNDRQIDSLEEPEEFLKNLSQRSNILVKNSVENTYKFFHLTIQEYLNALALKKKDEEMLINNFFDDWWLNSNIFYAGSSPDESDVLSRVSNLDKNKLDFDEKFNYIIHTSKVLQATHLLNKQDRKNILLSMFEVFDEIVKELVKDDLTETVLPKIKRKTILDIILWARNFFNEFFSSIQFQIILKEIWDELKKQSNFKYTDITEYILAYCLSVNTKNSNFLYEFIQYKKDINPRWYKIVTVDLEIKKLVHERNKIYLKVRQKAEDNKEYISKQFTQSISKHYKSITGL